MLYYFYLYLAAASTVILVMLIKKFKKLKSSQANQVNSPTEELQQSDQISDLKAEIGLELTKDDPDLEKLKFLQQQINQLQLERDEPTALSDDSSSDLSQSQPPKPHKFNSQNLLLYIGALLIVAGVGGFSLAVTRGSLQLITLLAIVALFYGGGLALRHHANLSPVGNAFIGTALGIIPFLGLAFYNFTHLSPELSWLLTSLIGIVAYVYAAIIMNNKVIAYLSMAFLVSTSCSLSAVLSLPMIYYCISVMVLGLILYGVSRTAKSETLGIMSDAVYISGRYLAMLAVIIGWSCMLITDIWVYVLLHTVVAIQMMVIWLDHKSLKNELIMRVAIHAAITVFITAFYLNNLAGTGFGWMIAATFHALLSLYLAQKHQSDPKRKTAESITLGLLEVPIVFSSIVLIHDQDWVMATSILSAWGIMTALSLMAIKIYKQKGWLFNITLTLIITPMVIILLLLDGAGSSSFALIYCVELAVMTLGLILATLKGHDFSGVGEASIGILSACAIMFCDSVVPKIAPAFIVLLAAVALAIYGYTRKNKYTEEAAVYCAVVGLCIMLNIIDPMHNPDSYMNTLKYYIIYAHSAALALIGTSLWLEKGPKRTRMAIGLIGLSTIFFLVINTYSMSLSYLLPVFLAEELLMLVAGIKFNYQWLKITGLIGVILATLKFFPITGWIWFIIQGLALIAFVIWQLVNKKPHGK